MDSVIGFYKSIAGTNRLLKIGNRKLIEEKVISEGGHAYVLLVKDAGNGQFLALKKINCQNRCSFNLACKEAKLLEKLPPHPNIIEYFGHSIESLDGHTKNVYLLTEYCGNGHLLNYLQSKNGYLQEKQILKVLTDMTMSLSHLHCQKPPIIHRDVKLENVLLCSNGLYKLCDFGSASENVFNISEMSKFEINELEEMISKTTTLMYRPPEMVDLYKKLIINEKADIWMLGCVLYSLIFNRHPFQDASILAITNSNFDIDWKRASIFPKLIDLIFWTLAPDPIDRPSAEDLLGILQKYNSMESVKLPKVIADRKEDFFLRNKLPDSSVSAAPKRKSRTRSTQSTLTTEFVINPFPNETTSQIIKEQESLLLDWPDIQSSFIQQHQSERVQIQDSPSLHEKVVVPIETDFFNFQIPISSHTSPISASPIGQLPAASTTTTTHEKKKDLSPFVSIALQPSSPTTRPNTNLSLFDWDS